MTSFLISRKCCLFSGVFKKKAKTPKSSASFPRNHCRYSRFPSSGATFPNKICKAAISDSPNAPCAQQRVITRIKQSGPGHALPALPLQQATGVFMKIYRWFTSAQLFIQLPRDYPVVRTTLSHHPAPLAVKSCILELENPSEPIPDGSTQALPNQASAARQKFCLQVAYSQVPTAGFL